MGYDRHASLSQSRIAMLIERLVKAAGNSLYPAYRVMTKGKSGKQYERTSLARYLDHVEQMYQLVAESDSYSYSEHLEVFKDACADIGLELSPFGITALSDDQSRYLGTEDALNRLVSRIRAFARRKQFQRRSHDRSYQARINQRQVSDYVDHVMARYARTVVVRIDFYYYVQVVGRLRIEDVFDDLDKLIRIRERHDLFSHEIGYICSVEQGEQRGFHIHAAFFFDGAHVRSDFWKAKQLGELWGSITDGRGYAHRCNDDKERYGERLGIGIFRRLDQVGRTNVRDAMHYLVEEGQHLRVKPVGARCLRMGSGRRR